MAKRQSAADQDTGKAAAQSNSFFLTGLGLMWASWLLVLFVSPILLSKADSRPIPTIVTHTLLMASTALTLFATCLASRKVGPLTKNRYLVVVAPLLAALGSAVVVLTQRYVIVSDVAGLVGPITAGVGNAWLLMMWGETYKNVSVRDANLNALLSAALALVIVIATFNLPVVAVFIVPVTLPILSALALNAQNRRQPLPENAAPRRLAPLPKRLILGIGTYGLAIGLIPGLSMFVADSSSTSDGYRTALLSGSAGVLLLIAGISLLMRSFVPRPVRSPVLALLAGALLLVPLVDQTHSPVGTALAWTGYGFFLMIVWAALCTVARQQERPATTVFGWGNAIAYSMMLLGILLSSLVGPDSQTWTSTALAEACMVVVLVILMLGANERTRHSEAASTTFQEDIIGQHCLEISRRYRLSAREAEVLGMLARGRDLPYIQSKLYISNGTAKTYVDRLYRKLGIHSRQEVINLAECGVPEQPADQSSAR